MIKGKSDIRSIYNLQNINKLYNFALKKMI